MSQDPMGKSARVVDCLRVPACTIGANPCYPYRYYEITCMTSNMHEMYIMYLIIACKWLVVAVYFMYIFNKAIYFIVDTI